MKKGNVLFFLLLIFCFCEITSRAQQYKIDSLEKLLQSTKQETTRLRLYLELSDVCTVVDNLKYAEPAIQLADKLVSSTRNIVQKKNILKQKARALNYIGYYYSIKGDTTKAIEFYKKQLIIYQEIKDTAKIVASILGLANYYNETGNIPNGLEYCQKGMSVSKELNYKLGIANSLYTMGQMYKEQGDTALALENIQNSLAIYYELKDTIHIANSIMRLGMLYGNLKNTIKALDYFEKGIAIYKKMKNEGEVLWAYRNIGWMYQENMNFEDALLYYQKSLTMSEAMNNFYWNATLQNEMGGIYLQEANGANTNAKREELIAKALDCHNKALKIALEHKDDYNIFASYNCLAIIYQKEKKYDKAKYFNDASLAIMTKLSAIYSLRDAEQLASKIDSARGDFKDAFAHLQHYIFLRDKLKSEEVGKAAAREKIKNEYDKQKAISKAEQDKKDLKVENEKRKQKIFLGSVLCGLAFVILFAGFIFRSLQITRKQKKTIEIQKAEVELSKIMIEEKNKDITDSIQYAKRIQQSLMPTEKYIVKTLKRLNKDKT